MNEGSYRLLPPPPLTFSSHHPFGTPAPLQDIASLQKPSGAEKEVLRPRRRPQPRRAAQARVVRLAATASASRRPAVAGDGAPAVEGTATAHTVSEGSGRAPAQTTTAAAAVAADAAASSAPAAASAATPASASSAAAAAPRASHRRQQRTRPRRHHKHHPVPAGVASLKLPDLTREPTTTVV